MSEVEVEVIAALERLQEDHDDLLSSSQKHEDAHQSEVNFLDDLFMKADTR